MKTILFLQFIFIFNLFLFTKTLDNHTLSNYEDIRITNLTGIFEPDFDEKIVKGSLNFTFHSKVSGSKIILDSRYINISSVFDIDLSEQLDFQYGEEELLGIPIIIKKEYAEEEDIHLKIDYNTTKNGNSAQFLEKTQTMSKTYPYFFTVSALTFGRELLPSQDTPAVKFPFYLGIKVMNPLRGMISGLYQENITNSDNTTTFYYYQKIPVPIYLIALAAGNIVEEKVNDYISVYSEPNYIENAKKEFEDMPEFLQYAVEYMGEYEWGQYNVLVLPYSFPYSGMENPCLTFTSPCLINGDKSLVDLIAHELIHSWSGNLVTNENWRDFWLNEGITKFLQRKVIARWQTDDYAKMDYILGLSYIKKYLEVFRDNMTYTTLRPNMTGVLPDDVFSNIPYEKGSNFMYYLEGIIGKEIMKEFLQNYFVHFKYQSVDFYQFQDYFIYFCNKSGVDEDSLNSIKWNEWIFEPGDCPVPNNFSNKYNDELQIVLDKFINENFTYLKENFTNMITTAKTVFFLTLEERNIFLTDRQHDFLTKELELYHNQNYLVTTHYLRLILKETDKFYEHELESLLKYLKTYGVSDFMDGIYRLFYKRDEIKAVETLESLKNFYHSIMYNMAEREINDAKNNFPILNVDILKNQCSLFSKGNTKLNIILDEYNDNLENVTISDGFYLISEKNLIKLECNINSKEKYCIIKDDITTTGEYTLTVKERIQKKEYAIKVQNGTTKYKVYINKIEIDTTTTKDIFEFDYGKSENGNVQIFFTDIPDKTVRIMNNDTEIKCNLESKTLECNINNNILSYDINNPNEFTNYTLKVVDYCNFEKYSFIVKVKNSTSSDSEPDPDPDSKPTSEPDSEPEPKPKSGGLETYVIVLIVISSVLILAIIIFFIIRDIRRRKNNEEININEAKKETLMSEAIE